MCMCVSACLCVCFTRMHISLQNMQIEEVREEGSAVDKVWGTLLVLGSFRVEKHRILFGSQTTTEMKRKLLLQCGNLTEKKSETTSSL